jgi:ATP-dependent Clp protease ATP-binding subunit ClpB
MGSQYIQSQFDDMEKRSSADRERLIEETKNGVLDLLKKTIRPEFLNRIDDIIMFRPLSEAEIRQIVTLQVGSIVRRMQTMEMTLTVDASAVDLISRAGFSPEFGARPVKRALQTLLLNDLSKALLAGTVDKTKPIRVAASGDHLTFSN